MSDHKKKLVQASRQDDVIDRGSGFVTCLFKVVPPELDPLHTDSINYCSSSECSGATILKNNLMIKNLSNDWGILIQIFI